MDELENVKKIEKKIQMDLVLDELKKEEVVDVEDELKDVLEMKKRIDERAQELI